MRESSRNGPSLGSPRPPARNGGAMSRYLALLADGDEFARSELAAEQVDEAGALPRGERADGLGRADAGDGE